MRTILIGILLLFYTILTWPLRLYNRTKNKEEREAANYKLLRRLVKMAVKVAGMDIKLSGKENIDNEKSYLIIANHKSDLDSLMLIWLFEKPFIFIGKDELKKTPIVNIWFKEIGCLFMDRDNIRQSAKIILEASEVLKGGKSVVIFPEGKRIMEDRLGEFKNGSFKLAIKSGKNILPIALVNSYKAFEESKRIKPTHVKINVGEEIEWKKLNYKNTSEICEHTTSVINMFYKF